MWIACQTSGWLKHLIEIGPVTGCLEVKCPFVCSRKSFIEASSEVPSFCLENSNGRFQLKIKHQYIYQVQIQMFITHLFWCNFVVWSPSKEILVERIDFNEKFTTRMVSKAWSFYFCHLWCRTQPLDPVHWILFH